MHASVCCLAGRDHMSAFTWGNRDRSADFELVAVLQHLNRVRCLAWSTRIEAPVLACGGSDGRVCAWRPLGEGRLRMKLSAAFLRRVKQGKEEVYAVLSLGRQFYITPDADIEREVLRCLYFV
jgi:hypothetical protein